MEEEEEAEGVEEEYEVAEMEDEEAEIQDEADEEVSRFCYGRLASLFAHRHSTCPLFSNRSPKLKRRRLR